MNQKQADNLVRLIEYFESVPEDNVALESVGGVAADLASFDRKSMTIKVQECGSTFCLAGHLPYAFPELYTESSDFDCQFDYNEIEITFDYPTCKGLPKTDLYGDPPIMESFEKNFGISQHNPILQGMVDGGIHPYDYVDSGKEAVLKFLRDQLDEHGYEIAEVTA